MAHLDSLLVFTAACAVLLLGLAAGGCWCNQDVRRIRRALRKVLRGEPHGVIIAHGQGRGAAINFANSTIAVAWDAGEWCLIYRIEELLGLELIIDGRVVRRASALAPRWPREPLVAAQARVWLRLVFDDPHYGDFVLELWSAAHAASPQAPDASQAIEEGAGWLARLEPVLRRKPPAAARPRAIYRASSQARFTWASTAARLMTTDGGGQQGFMAAGE